MTRPVQGVPRTCRDAQPAPGEPVADRFTVPGHLGGQANDAVSARSRRQPGRLVQRHQITRLCPAPRPKDRMIEPRRTPVPLTPPPAPAPNPTNPTPPP